MAVRIHYTGVSDKPEAWKEDWPVADRSVARSSDRRVAAANP
jgi:hypothetical protein